VLFSGGDSGSGVASVAMATWNLRASDYCDIFSRRVLGGAWGWVS
jgi:hypothetical protein